MRKIFPSTEAGHFKVSPKKVLRLIGTAGLFASLMTIAAMFFQTTRGAPVPAQAPAVIGSDHSQLAFTIHALSGWDLSAQKQHSTQDLGRITSH